MRKYLAAAFVSVALATAGTAASQQSQSPQGLSEQDGLLAMRVAMTVEANAPFGKAGFGTLDDVIAKGNPNLHVDRIDSSSATLLDYVLRINRSDDKLHYSASLTPVKGCGPAWFGNDRGLIYTGKALGC